MENEGRHIPNRLKRYRKITGRRQKHIARFLGLRNTNLISLWEKGLAMPTSKNLIKLCELYNIHPRELYPELSLEFKEELINIQSHTVETLWIEN